MMKMQTRGLVDLVIQGGKVVTPAGTSKQWVAVNDGTIVAMGLDESPPPEAKKTIDATGKYVLPGVIDNEHHPNVNPPEDMVRSETRASIAAGVTTVGIEYTSTVFARPPKPFPKPEEVSNFMSIMPAVKELETGKHIWTDYFFTPWMTNDEHAKEIPDLAEKHGVTSFKFYLHNKGGEHIWDMWGVMKYLGVYYHDDGTVYTAMRNVAAVGAVPYGMTDCLNFGNPEVPEAFNDFVQSVKGLADAATKISLKDDGKSAVPFVSGNVSFYNESVSGKQVDPSPVIACVGYLEDYSKAITMKIKEKGSSLFLVGERKDELGGSVYYELNDEIGANVPEIDFKKQKNMIYAVIDCIDRGLLLSCHDISDGGLLVTLAEMILGGEADGQIGAEIKLTSGLRADKALFSESSGFVFEVNDKNIEDVRNIFEKYDLELIELGKTTDNKKLVIDKVNLKIEDMKKAWTSGLIEALE